MKKRYELLREDIYFEEKFEDFAQCEGHWHEIDEEFVKMKINSTLEVMTLSRQGRPEHLEGDTPYELLAAGKVIHPIIGFIREKNDLPKCPLCGASYESNRAALSRRDNQTRICSSCGMQEAFQDLFNMR